MRVVRGVTRLVVLAGPFAFKFPNPSCWRLFLTGLLANLHETLWWHASGRDPRLCPVLFSLWGGWLVVMRRALPLAPSECKTVPWEYFDGLPLDPKPSNVGRLNGRLVLLDYGN